MANAPQIYYNVTVSRRGADGSPSVIVARHTEVGGSKVIPCTPPILGLLDRAGHEMMLITLEQGMEVAYEKIMVPELVLAHAVPRLISGESPHGSH